MISPPVESAKFKIRTFQDTSKKKSKSIPLSSLLPKKPPGTPHGQLITVQELSLTKLSHGFMNTIKKNNVQRVNSNQDSKLTLIQISKVKWIFRNDPTLPRGHDLSSMLMTWKREKWVLKTIKGSWGTSTTRRWTEEQWYHLPSQEDHQKQASTTLKHQSILSSWIFLQPIDWF